MASKPSPWERCGKGSCAGSRLPTTPFCLAHTAEEAVDAFDAELKRIGTEGTVDARGVVVSDELLARVLDALPRTHDRPTFTTAHFQRASFQGEALFGGAIFQGEALFGEATFQGKALFSEATFQGEARFNRATFEGAAGFSQATFQGDAGFYRATFQGEVFFDGATVQGEARFDQGTFQGMAVFEQASFLGSTVFGEASFHGETGFDAATFHGRAAFGGATFLGRASFDGATIHGTAAFDRANFQGEAWFSWASFQGHVQFDGASFQAEAWFNNVSFQKVASFVGASFQGDIDFAGATFPVGAWFDRASFERATRLGPLLARRLVLDAAVFGARVQLQATAAALCARRARFPAGIHLRLRYATVDLDDADLAAPAILAGSATPFSELADKEQQLARGWERLPPGPRAQRWRPRLLSVRRADVAGLHLAEVDLRACRFAGAHNLDRLRIEGAPPFARTPGWWRARRKTLAEEQHWRAARPRRWRKGGWYPRACQPPASPMVNTPAVVEPARLAALYRELRKGREDAKDEPGAADFYYGECEMRRHDPGTAKAERAVLWLYWLVSGYALRASRAVLAWALLVVVGAVIVAGIGFKPPVSPQIIPVDASHGQVIYQKRGVSRPSSVEQLPEAFAFSAESTVSVLRGPDRALTLPGRWTQMSLRVLGPVLFGLAVLSLRGRVRR
jgi:hypothetical protein